MRAAAVAAWLGAPGAPARADEPARAGEGHEDDAAVLGVDDRERPLPIAPDPVLTSSCARCHGGHWSVTLRAPVWMLPQSVHGEEEVGCTGCHGGDPEDPTVGAHSVRFGFRPAPSAGEVVQLCGACHEEHGEVVAEYLGSTHATAALTGGKGATCFACHGAHGIRRVEDPASLVHPTNVADTCGGCHSDAIAMVGTGLPLDQRRQYVASVHGRARAAGNEEAPTCAGCHDPHEGEAGLAAVAACAGCHEPYQEAFQAGPHAAAFASRGFLDCVECHGSHEVREADFTLVASAASSSCRRCHAPGQENFEDVQRLAALVTRADDALRASGLADEPIEPDTQVGRARASLGAAVHALDLEALDAAVGALVEALPDPPPEGARRRPGAAAAASEAGDGGCSAGGGPLAGLAGGVLLALAAARRGRRTGGDR